MTAALSIPFNGAFFSYSTAVEHTVNAAFMGSTPPPGSLRDAVVEKLRTRLLPTVATSIAVWVPVNAANFTLVPLHNRNLVASAFACGWNVFLSLQQHGKHQAAEASLRQLPASGSGEAAAARASGTAHEEGQSADSRASSLTESG